MFFSMKKMTSVGVHNHKCTSDKHISGFVTSAQMFARKYQRIAAEFTSKGAVFFEILGDESADTRVSCFFV